MDKPHRRSIELATAAMLDLISRAQAMQALVLRGEDAEALERMRVEFHDAADAYLDHTIHSARAVRAILDD
jgi:hypothetical protein